MSQTRALDLNLAQKCCLKNSQDLLASQLQERAARLSYLQSISAFMPSIDLSSGPVGLEGLTSVNLHQISISQALINPQLSVRKAQKRLDWCRSILDKIATENRLLLSIRTAYFCCVLKKAIEQDHLDRAQLLQSLLAQERSRLIGGQSTELEVNRLDVNLLHALAAFLDAKRATRSAESELSNLIGWNECSDRIFDIVDQEISPEKISFLEKALARLPKDLHLDLCRATAPLLFEKSVKNQFIADALNYQPAMKMAKLELMSNRLCVKEQKSHYWPCVAANFLRNNIEYPNGTLINGKQRWQAQVRVSYKLFDGLSCRRGLQSSELKVKALKQLLLKRQMDLKKMISERLDCIEVKLMIYSAAQKEALVAKQILTRAKERYSLGEITSLDLRQSANQMLHANVLKKSAGFDAITAYFKLCSDCADGQRDALDALTRQMECV